MLSKSLNKDKRNIRDFIFALEKFADLACLKVSSNEDETVKEVLKYIESLAKQFFNLKNKNYERFQYLLSQADIYNEEIKLNLPSIRSDKEDNSETTGLESMFKTREDYVAFENRSRELNFFGRFLNAYGKIWEQAFNMKNEISRYVVYHIEYLLAELSQKAGNESQIEQILGFLKQISWIIVSKDKDKYKDKSIYAASVDWYNNIVFNKLKSNESGFCLDYLDIFDKYLFSSIQILISENQERLFNHFISSAIDGIMVPSYNQTKILNYGHILSLSQTDYQKYQEINKEHKIEEKITKLEKSQYNIDSRKKLEDWLSNFDNLKNILSGQFSNDQIDEAKKIEGEIKEYVDSVFKYNNLMELIYAVGSYCVFKKRFKYIKYLFEYKQPADSDASWGGNDIVPKSLEEIIKLYFSKGAFEHKFEFWEGHHGSEIYFKQYFLLLLAKFVNELKPNADNKYERIEKFILPDFNSYTLSYIEDSAETFITMAEVLKSEKNNDILLGIGIDSRDIEEIIDKKIIPFIRLLKEKSKNKIEELKDITSISEDKVNSFKEQLILNFNKSAVMKSILKNYNLYKNESTDVDIDRFGINIVDDKAAFFDEWYVHYHNYGENYGQDLASGEDNFIVNEISKLCKDEKDLDSAIKKIDNLSETIIIAVNAPSITLPETIRNNYQFKWQCNKNILDIVGFDGFYKNDIPLFEVFTRPQKNKYLLVLNKTLLGTLKQYPPLKKDENKTDQADIFYVKINDFSEEAFLANFLSKPPKWLEEMGDNKKQREYLKKRALINIYEKFEFEKHQQFIGYIVNIK